MSIKFYLAANAPVPVYSYVASSASTSSFFNKSRLV